MPFPPEAPTLYNIPVEILLQILSYIPYPEIRTTAMVNTIWRRLSLDNSIRKNIYESIFAYCFPNTFKSCPMKHKEYNRTTHTLDVVSCRRNKISHKIITWKEKHDEPEKNKFLLIYITDQNKWYLWGYDCLQCSAAGYVDKKPRLTELNAMLQGKQTDFFNDLEQKAACAKRIEECLSVINYKIAYTHAYKALLTQFIITNTTQKQFIKALLVGDMITLNRLKTQIDLNSLKDANKESLLHWAVRERNQRVAIRLKFLGIDELLFNNNAETAGDIASQQEDSIMKDTLFNCACAYASMRFENVSTAELEQSKTNTIKLLGKQISKKEFEMIYEWQKTKYKAKRHARLYPQSSSFKRKRSPENEITPSANKRFKQAQPDITNKALPTAPSKKQTNNSSYLRV